MQADTFPADGLGRAIGAGLLDDAALFPPGEAPMPQAVAAHRDWRAGSAAWLVGPFVVAVAALPELSRTLDDRGDDREFAVSLVVRGGVTEALAGIAALAADPRLRLAALEISVAGEDSPLAAARAVAAELPQRLPHGCPLAVETGWSVPPEACVTVLSGSSVRWKLRTGGVTAAAFPDAAQVAAALVAADSAGLPVKCTAGLHQAVRHDDAATGFTYHGFLNILLAAAAAPSGVPSTVAALAATSVPEVVAAVRALGVDGVTRARTLLTSFGTCSVAEPMDELVALGLLVDPRVSRYLPEWRYSEGVT